MSKNIKINLLVFIISSLLVSCGYKKISQESLLINIQNINIIADKRISYKLKNDILLISDTNSTDKYNLDLNLDYKKTSKIIDKTGKTTRYTLSYTGILKLKNIDSEETINKSFTVNGDYSIAENYSDTINNEKNTTSGIIDKISNDITNFITLYFKNK
mgnify:CR=1 FL=1|tara:strand:+ start:57 stop:533 length:477 start_codon:yes stop_codon:yes gene_type:complete